MKPSKPSRRPRLSGWLPLLVFASLAIAAIPGSAQQFTVLHTFEGGSSDGAYPFAGLAADRYGNLYGTTLEGGTNFSGTVFKVTLTGAEKVIYNVPTYGLRSGPQTGVVIDRQGNVYASPDNYTSEVPGYFGSIMKITPAGVTTTFYAFTGGNDGAWPALSFIADQNGDIYGTTLGSIFKLTPKAALTTLYTFTETSDGVDVNPGLIVDRSGDLYGTTYEGGQNNLGVVFKLTPSGREIVLHSFAGGNDGSNPFAGLVADSEGNLYGTTQLGGRNNEGTVFKLTPEGKETVIHIFGNGNDGAFPGGGLIIDQRGYLYGATVSGGDKGGGLGTIFKVAPTGAETVLYSFAGLSDGSRPMGTLLADNGGHLFGTASSYEFSGFGTVFKLSLPGAFSGIPGEPDCVERSVSELALQYGGTARAAHELGYSSVEAMYNAASAYCQCGDK
jgi:uncharacterized repeat protein (TIGR03803 family)